MFPLKEKKMINFPLYPFLDPKVMCRKFRNYFANSVIELIKLFQDGSGTISTKELLPVMRSMGQNPTEDEVLNLVIEYDVNGDGTIDFDEFLEMMRKQAEQQDNSAELKEAFKIFDRDGNGYIDAAELKKV